MAAVIGNREISLGVMGGTLITAACYGGGEVFGCSPYDAATTAYLKATYGAYWAQIRDYGFANPQLVPWINEDNDLIVSLVEVGKERWLKTETNAHIKLGTITLDNNAEIEADVMAIVNSWNTPFGLKSWSSGFGVFYNNDHSIRPWWSNNNYNTKIAGCDWADNTKSHIVAKVGYFEADGTVYYQGTITKSTQTDIFYLFRCGGSSNFFKGSLGVIKLKDTTQDVDFWLAPFIRNGEKGMLDLLTGTFYPNANTSGAFTIELTDTPT